MLRLHSFLLIVAYIKLCKCMICMFIHLLFGLLFISFFLLRLLLLSFHFTRSRSGVRVISRTLNGIVDMDATSTCSILFFIIVFLSSFPPPLIFHFFFTFRVIQNNFYGDFFLFRFKVTLQLLIVCSVHTHSLSTYTMRSCVVVTAHRQK